MTTVDHLQLVRTLARDHEVFGELGRKDNGDVWFLARKEGDPALVALRLTTRGADEWGDPIHDIAVAREVGSDVSVAAATCQDCGSSLRTFARFCGHCGADQTRGLRTGADPDEQRALLAHVREAAGAQYEVLGEIPRAEGGGVVYFARKRSDGGLVQLRLRIGGEGMELGETHVGNVLDTTITESPIRPSARHPLPVPRPSPLGVTRPTAAEMAASAGPTGPPATGPTDRERRLTLAVGVLAAIVVIETLLLLLR